MFCHQVAIQYFDSSQWKAACVVYRALRVLGFIFLYGTIIASLLRYDAINLIILMFF